MAVTTKKTFNAVGSGGQGTTVFTPVSIELNNQDDLDVYVTLAATGSTRVLQLRQATGSTADGTHPQVNDTTGLYFPSVTSGTSLYNYTLSADNNTITFNSALPTGAVVSIERRTRDSSSDYTNFAGGSTIRATQLNDAFDESNFTAQEARNKAFELEDLINRYGDGNLSVKTGKSIRYEGATDDNNETTLTVTDPTADRTITLPNQSGTVPLLAVTSNTQITSTPEELNILDGVTATTAEINILDGVTATTAEINIIDGVTATTAEINKLDGVTASTAELNLVDGVTATTAELNILDGVTATAAEINTLDGVTSTTAELNLLDGVTSTTAELNYVDGVTSNVQTQLDAKQPLDAELTELATMAGTTASSLADLTQAEVQILDGATLSTAELNYVDGVTSNLQTQLNAKQPLDGDLTTLAGAASGTASIIGDSSKTLTADIDELNLLDGKSIVTSISGSATDVQLPSAQAVNERIVELVTEVGGFHPVANETSFPTTNPDINDGAGTIVSVKALASNLTSNGSGVATIANGAGSGNTVTINGMSNSTTYAAGKGLILETTSTLHTYTFHRLVMDETGVNTAQTLVNDFNNRYRILASGTNINTVGSLDDGDLLWDSNTNTMKVYDASASQWGEVTSVGDFKLLTVVPAGATSGTPDYANNATFDLRDGSNAASVTSVGQLLVSVNGVIQKPNTGTSAPSEGFALVDGNTIIFGANPGANASVYVTQIGAAVAVNVPATNSIVEDAIQSNVVSEVKLKISNAGSNGQFLSKQSGNTGGLTWADAASEGTDIASTGESGGTKYLREDGDGTCSWQSVPAGVGGATGVDFNDNVKARFGTGNDVLLEHNGTYFQIADGGNSNPSSLWFYTASNDGIVLANNRGVGNSYIARFMKTDGCKLYHNTNEKLATSATGITVTGTVAATAYTGDGSALTGLDSTKAGGAIYENSQTISTTHTLTANTNGMSAGPVTVNSGITLTIPSGATYTIV